MRTRNIIGFLALGCLALTLSGCNSNREKDINKDKDRPQPAEKKVVPEK